MTSTAGSTSTPSAGEMIAAKYRVEGEAGARGRVRVVDASETTTGAKVRIALVDDCDAEASARVQRKARSVMGVESEFVERIRDAGIDGDRVYVVTNPVEGESLARALEARGPFATHDAVEIVIQLADAVAEAHAAAVVHGSVGLEQVILGAREDGSPRAVLVDFCAHDAISPDVAEGASDVRGLGEILRALLTGASDASAKPKVELDVDMTQILERATSPDAPARFVSAFALVAVLAPYAPVRAMTTLERITRLSEPGVESTQQILLSPYAGPASARAVRNFVAQVPIPTSTRFPGVRSMAPLLLGIIALLALFAIVLVLVLVRGHDVHEHHHPHDATPASSE